MVSFLEEMGFTPDLLIVPPSIDSAIGLFPEGVLPFAYHSDLWFYHCCILPIARPVHAFPFA